MQAESQMPTSVNRASSHLLPNGMHYQNDNHCLVPPTRCHCYFEYIFGNASNVVISRMNTMEVYMTHFKYDKIWPCMKQYVALDASIGMACVTCCAPTHVKGHFHWFGTSTRLKQVHHICPMAVHVHLCVSVYNNCVFAYILYTLVELRLAVFH